MVTPRTILKTISAFSKSPPLVINLRGENDEKVVKVTTKLVPRKVIKADEGKALPKKPQKAKKASKAG